MKHNANFILDLLFKNVTRLFSFFVFLLLLAIVVSLFYLGCVAIAVLGFSFFWSIEVDPVRQLYGALVPIIGTLLTSAIALCIAVPASFGIALFLTELSPGWLRRPLGTAIEMLAAIPSIIYGMWGLFVFVPLFQRYLQPHVIDFFSGIPVLESVFGGPPFGIGLFPAGLILSIMVTPFLTIGRE